MKKFKQKISSKSKAKKPPELPASEVPDLINFDDSDDPEDFYSNPDDLCRNEDLGSQDLSGSLNSIAMSSGSWTPVNAHPSPTPRVTKMPLMQSKSQLPQHSVLSMVKKNFSGVQEGTPYYKMLYAEKKVGEGLNKFILARAEAKDAWSEFMRDESNWAIKDLYQRIGELDYLWVELHMKYKTEVGEMRKLFKLFSLAESNLDALHKKAKSAAAKVNKVQKQMDDALTKSRSSKGNVDLKKLEHIQKELEKAVYDDNMLQNEYTKRTQSHQVFRYNKIQRTMAIIAEAEINLYQHMWKISEAKLQLTKIYMGTAHSKLTWELQQQAREESHRLLSGLYQELQIPLPPDSEQPRPFQPPQPMSSQMQTPPFNPQIKNPLGLRPSAPASDVISQRSYGSGHSAGSSNPEVTDYDAFYCPIPDNDEESDVEIQPEDEEYIYEYADDEFDEPDEDQIYENVETQKTPNYLALEDDTKRANRSPCPVLPPRANIRITPVDTEEDVYEDYEENPRKKPLVINTHPTGKTNNQDEIFGTISSLQLNNRTPKGTSAHKSHLSVVPQTSRNHQVDSSKHHSFPRSQHQSLWPSLSGMGEEEVDVEGGNYGCVWESNTGQGSSVDSSPCSSNPPSRSGSSNQGNGVSRSSTVSSSGSEEVRYVDGPGHLSDRISDITSEFKQKLQMFEQQRRDQTLAKKTSNLEPPKLPPRVRRPLPDLP